MLSTGWRTGRMTKERSGMEHITTLRWDAVRRLFKGIRSCTQARFRIGVEATRVMLWNAGHHCFHVWNLQMYSGAGRNNHDRWNKTGCIIPMFSFDFIWQWVYPHAAAPMVFSNGWIVYYSWWNAVIFTTSSDQCINELLLLFYCKEYGVAQDKIHVFKWKGINTFEYPIPRISKDMLIFFARKIWACCISQM